MNFKARAAFFLALMTSLVGAELLQGCCNATVQPVQAGRYHIDSSSHIADAAASDDDYELVLSADRKDVTETFSRRGRST